MGETTGISWCDHTWNPWIGCMKVSPACDGCYAAALMGDEGRYKRVVWGEPGKGAGTRVQTSPGTFNAPLKWDRAAAKAGVKRFVFVPSLADIFDNEVPIEWLAQVFAMMRRTPNLIYLALTKRPQLIVKRFQAACPDSSWPENVFAGTTVEDMERTRNVLSLLTAQEALKIPLTFLSCEPLLSDLGNLDWMFARYGGAGLGWVITGGETDQGGHKARPTHPDWLRSIRDQCAAAGVPYHHKQNGEWAGDDQVNAFGGDRPLILEDGSASGQAMFRVGKGRSGRLLDGVLHDAKPTITT